MAEYSSPEPLHPTPQQLNAELISIVDLLPKVHITDAVANADIQQDERGPSLEAQDAIEGRRLSSDVWKKLEKHISELVDKANITHYFKQYIIEAFTWEMGTGSSPNVGPDFNRQFFFLDTSRPRSGGIFDPNRVGTLERIALTRKATETAGLQKGLVKLVGEEQARRGYASQWQAIEDWRNQIKQRYPEPTQEE